MRPTMIVWSVFVSLIFGTGCHRGPTLHDLREAVAVAAGSGAQDCGFGANEAPTLDAATCAAKALESKRAFFVAFEGAGIDSKIIHALAVNDNGLAVRFTWDSDIYGGGNRFFTKSRIESTACDAPVVSADGPTIRCANHAPGA